MRFIAIQSFGGIRNLKWIRTFVGFTLVVVSFSLVITVPTVDGKKCPGKCIGNATECKAKGGKIVGYCTNELACCDYSYKKIGSCGSKMSRLTTAIFQSPDYPDNSHGDLVCQFDFAISENATAIIVDFSDILIDGQGFVRDSGCESDMFFLKGFPDWTPPARCGNLSSYAAVIDLGSNLTKGMEKLTVLALMSSKKYRWNIKISQLFQVRKKSGIRTTTTEAPTDNDENDKENEEGGDDNEDVAVSGEYEESSYDSPGKKEEMKQNSQEDLESEEEEMLRIMQLASRAKLPRIGATETLVLPGEDEEESGYPAEEQFIVNGDDTEISSVPWQASLRTIISPRLAKVALQKLKLKNCTLEEGLHFCGGSIISDSHILTATHCFSIGEKLRTWQRTTTMKVVLGDTDLCDENTDGVQEFKIEKVYFHYAYDVKTVMNDVVVLKLNRKIRFTDKIQQVKMAADGMDFQQKLGFASGWGRTNLTETSEGAPELLQSADDMFIGNNSYCINQQLYLYGGAQTASVLKYPKYGDVFSSLLCTYIRNGSISRVVGQGDSGGPLVVRVPVEKKSKSKSKSKKKSKSSGDLFADTQKTEPLLVGVISYMIPVPHAKNEHDVSKYVDFYQSVPYYRKWIHLAMQ